MTNNTGFLDNKLQLDYLTRHITVQCFLLARCWRDHEPSEGSALGTLCQLAWIHDQTIIQVLKQ